LNLCFGSGAEFGKVSVFIAAFKAGIKYAQEENNQNQINHKNLWLPWLEAVGD
jgi:hypothetical protein